MKLLLINPPLRRREENVWKIVFYSMPPIGLAIVAACAKREGIETKILDAFGRSENVLAQCKSLYRIVERDSSR